VPGDKVDANIEGQKFTAEVKVREHPTWINRSELQ
jgi:hypothetical protein